MLILRDSSLNFPASSLSHPISSNMNIIEEAYPFLINESKKKKKESKKRRKKKTSNGNPLKKTKHRKRKVKKGKRKTKNSIF